MYICDQLFHELDELEEKYIDFWKDICNIESPTDYKKGVDCVGERIEQEALMSGFKVEVIEQKYAGNLVKVTFDNNSLKKPIIVSAHIDTVHPIGSFGYPPVKISGEKIYGPGVIDDKGGVSAALFAMEALKKCGYNERNIIFIAQTDEEVSSILSNYSTINYICDIAKNSEVFINCESLHAGEAILIRKGIARYKFQIRGEAAHSARCFLGKSALLEAAYKIIDIEKFKNKDGITCNCSLISGGDVANTVPERCEFTVDVRYFNEAQFEYIDLQLREISKKSYIGDTDCKIECLNKRPAMELTEQNYNFLKKINRIYTRNGMETLSIGTSLGGSDAANVSNTGVTTVDSLGCEGGKIHTTDEFAYIRSLKESAKRIASIIYCYDIAE